MKVAVFGATSAIAQAVERLMAARGDRLFLVARNRQRLDAIAADLKVRGAAAVAIACQDLADTDQHRGLVAQVAQALDGIDAALIAYGALGDQTEAEHSFAQAREIFAINMMSPVSLLGELAARLLAQGHGTLAVIGSVAGDRGRRSNFVYGASKAGLSTYLQGLRARLFSAGIRVVEIKPGFVDTPMTNHLRRPRFASTPARIAPAILAAIDRGTDVVYVPRLWRPVMALIKLLPEAVSKRLSY
jgi:decaprenylphospho-beta-D-erythro-pentofuranosid-2-ulose 2-reductase